MKHVLLFITLLAVTPFSSADSLKETKRLMALNKKVDCSFVREVDAYVVGSGEPVLNIKEEFFTELKPEASSTSDFATWSLDWEEGDFYFHYFMNSQIGGITIEDKTLGRAQTSLDISDMGKEHPILGDEASSVVLGDVSLSQTAEIELPHNGKLVNAEQTITLTGSCRRVDKE